MGDTGTRGGVADLKKKPGTHVSGPRDEGIFSIGTIQPTENSAGKAATFMLAFYDAVAPQA